VGSARRRPASTRAIAVRLEQTQRPPEQQSQKSIDRQMGKVNAALDAMANGLEGKNWCHNNAYSLADIAVGCALGYLDFRFPQIDWRAQHPSLDKLYGAARRAPELHRYGTAEGVTRPHTAAPLPAATATGFRCHARPVWPPPGPSAPFPPT